jgi:hypothetical protein
MHVSNISCPGHKSIQVCKSQEKRNTGESLFQLRVKQAGERLVVSSRDSPTKQIDGHRVFGAVKLPGI